jgi:hypothetical protein
MEADELPKRFAPVALLGEAAAAAAPLFAARGDGVPGGAAGVGDANLSSYGHVVCRTSMVRCDSERNRPNLAR